MARTKKVGITGRFGARYGRKAKRQVKKIEENNAKPVGDNYRKQATSYFQNRKKRKHPDIKNLL